MFEIRHNALYTRSDLVEALAPLGIDPDGWIGRIRPAKRFRQAWWGRDLIDAIEAAPALNERPEMKRAANLPHAGRGRSRRTKPPATPALDAQLAGLKEQMHGFKTS